MKGLSQYPTKRTYASNENNFFHALNQDWCQEKIPPQKSPHVRGQG